MNTQRTKHCSPRFEPSYGRLEFNSHKCTKVRGNHSCRLGGNHSRGVR